MRLWWIWPLTILLSILAVSLAVFLFPTTPLRPWLVVEFLFLCPGMALVRNFRLANPAADWTLAIALSIAIDAIVAAIFLYTGNWSPVRILVALVDITLCGVGLQCIAAYRYHRRQRVQLEPIALL